MVHREDSINYLLRYPLKLYDIEAKYNAEERAMFNWKFIDEIKTEEKPTAESLRAAAKVLEEKAVELEKPVVSDHTRKVLAYAEEKNIAVIRWTNYDDNKFKWVSADPDDSDYGDTWGTEKTFEEAIMNGYWYCSNGVMARYIICKRYACRTPEMFLIV